MLAGKFRVERVVGRGGMGVVVEATNVQLDQKVALKLLATNADDPAVVERFSREARAAARLRSEHVARVYDVGKDTLHGPFIVMELLEGKTLGDVIQAGRVATHRAVEYIIDACEGLAEAHVRGIVHQDVKPANLFLVTGADGRPSIKLLDFGIATTKTKEREADAKSSSPYAGTPAYLSPEQLRGSAPVDHRSDIWSLGCVLFELLTGERAFQATRFTELVTKILETPPAPFPADLDLPPALAAVVMRCLEKDPGKRFSTTGALALALLPFARRRAHSAVMRAVGQVKSGGLDPTLEMPSSMPPPPVSDRESVADFPSSAQLRAPSVPSIPGIAIAPGKDMRSTTSPSISAATPAPRQRRGEIALVAVVLLLLVGGLVIWLRMPSEPAVVGARPDPRQPSQAAAQPKLAEPSPSATATPTTPPETPPTMASSVASATASANTPRSPRGFPASPRPTARPTTSGTAAPTSTEADIRLTR
jgi:serine/threonine protein kinase